MTANTTSASAPYHSALFQIADTTRRLNLITGNRKVSEDIAVGVLNAQSNLAIATSLLAVADAIRATNAGPMR